MNEIDGFRIEGRTAGSVTLHAGNKVTMTISRTSAGYHCSLGYLSGVLPEEPHLPQDLWERVRAAGIKFLERREKSKTAFAPKAISPPAPRISRISPEEAYRRNARMIGEDPDEPLYGKGTDDGR